MVDFKWQRRWVVLKHGRLKTFQDEACLSPKAAFELNACSKVVPFKAPGAPGQSVLYSRTRPFGFVLDLEPQAGKSRWMVYFDTLQPDELDRWTQAIEGSVRSLEAAVQRSPGRSGHLSKQVPGMATAKQGEDSAGRGADPDATAARRLVHRVVERCCSRSTDELLNRRAARRVLRCILQKLCRTNNAGRKDPAVPLVLSEEPLAPFVAKKVAGSDQQATDTLSAEQLAIRRLTRCVLRGILHKLCSVEEPTLLHQAGADSYVAAGPSAAACLSPEQLANRRLARCMLRDIFQKMSMAEGSKMLTPASQEPTLLQQAGTDSYVAAGTSAAACLSPEQLANRRLARCMLRDIFQKMSMAEGSKMLTPASQEPTLLQQAGTQSYVAAGTSAEACLSPEQLANRRLARCMLRDIFQKMSMAEAACSQDCEAGAPSLQSEARLELENRRIAKHVLRGILQRVSTKASMQESSVLQQPDAPSPNHEHAGIFPCPLENTNRLIAKHVLRCVLQKLYRIEDPSALLAANPAICVDKRQAKRAVKRNSALLRHLPQEMRVDKGVVLAAVQTDPMALAHAGDTLKSDREVVFAAISQDGMALQHSSDALKADRDIVLAAALRSPDAIQFASEAVKEDAAMIVF
ncbi:unnamed protein product [Symbiodinium sp. CCMP2592]|nr:unnamed protein product [Symbiodinium sp. CCMP2592]